MDGEVESNRYRSEMSPEEKELDKGRTFFRQSEPSSSQDYTRPRKNRILVVRPPSSAQLSPLQSYIRNIFSPND